MQSFFTESDEETLQCGAALAEKLRAGNVVALDGDLGAGKTVFVKGIAKGLGIAEVVVSPTFTIVREYAGRLPLYHFDVYRISDPEEMEDIGFSEYLFGNGVTVVEWAEKVAELLPEDYIRVTIEKTGDTGRKIVIQDGAGE